jgi:hypothetical protein
MHKHTWFDLQSWHQGSFGIFFKMCLLDENMCQIGFQSQDASSIHWPFFPIKVLHYAKLQCALKSPPSPS